MGKFYHFCLVFRASISFFRIHIPYFLVVLVRSLQWIERILFWCVWFFGVQLTDQWGKWNFGPPILNRSYRIRYAVILLYLWMPFFSMIFHPLFCEHMLHVTRCISRVGWKVAPLHWKLKLQYEMPLHEVSLLYIWHITKYIHWSYTHWSTLSTMIQKRLIWSWRKFRLWTSSQNYTLCFTVIA